VKVQLISMPVGDLTQPYTSLPTLTAQLRRAGVHTEQKDFGIEFARYWLMPSRLPRLLAVLRDRIGEIEARGPSSADWETYVDLKVLAAQFSGRGRPDELLEALRDPAILEDVPRLSRLLRLLGGFQSLIAVAERDAFAPATSFHAATRDQAQRAIRDPHFLYGDFVADALVPEIAADPPSLLGISVTYPRQLYPALVACAAIRRAAPATRIVLGGAYLSTVVETFLERPEVGDLWDFVVDGEGESALVGLVQALAEGGTLERIPNLIYQQDRAPIRSNRQRYEENIHALATPDFTGLNLDSYFAPEIVFLLPVARGCYMRCTFCAISYATSGYRCRTGPEIVGDIRRVQEQFGKCRAAKFNFSIDVMAPKHLDAMATAMAEADLGISWDAEIRLDSTLRSEIIQRMRAAGCKHLRFGLESAVDRVREMMDKRVKIARVEEILRDCRAQDIKASTMLIVGFPGETEQEARETFRFVRDRANVIRFYALSVFTVSRGSIIAERPQDFGVNLRPRPDRFVQPSWDFTVTSGLTTDQARTLAGEFQRRLKEAYPLADEGFSVGIGGSFTFLVADRWSWQELLVLDHGQAAGQVWEGEDSVLELSARVDLIRSPWLLPPPPDRAAHPQADEEAIYVTTTDNNLLRLTSASARLLEEVDGQRTVAEIAASTLSAEAAGDDAALWSREVASFLSSLVGLGVLRNGAAAASPIAQEVAQA
jgi:anaerobic magnesium-protoporphyrin IX monomethyl ester cyclase